MTQDEATGGDATLDDEVVAITAEANELGRATMKWRRLDDASLAALAKRHRAVRARIDAYRDARDDDPDHDALVDADEVLSDVKSCLARARKARRLVTEAAAIDDAGFLDWLEATAREELPLSSLWERGSTFFGRSKGRAERIFASLAWESVPDPDRIVPLLGRRRSRATPTRPTISCSSSRPDATIGARARSSSGTRVSASKRLAPA